MRATATSDERAPTRADALLFEGKATLLRARRAARDLFAAEPRRHPRGGALAAAAVLAESTTPLWSSATGAERALEVGKVHNLRIAARALDGVEVPAGAVFGFWAHVGRATRRRGYVAGRELREGCVVPAIGGGICQLSNALYDAASRAGFEILERHRHSRVVPGSLAELDRDATVFWNYVDLRFRSASAFRVEVSLTEESLVVRYRGEGAAPGARRPALRVLAESRAPGDCAACDEEGCFRKGGLPDADVLGRTAYLVDEVWPEHDRWIAGDRAGDAVLGLPLAGRANYAWSTAGFARVGQARLVTLRRALESRRLAAQSAARQRALLANDERLAVALSRLLDASVTRVVAAQTLLPYLWRDGHLGGRAFDVLMTRLPLRSLHERLDAAVAAHPASPTLGDFRAPDWLVDAEAEALARARRVVTPHAEIARLFGDRAVLVDWSLPRASAPAARGDLIVFPGPTLGRKGAYEARGVAEALGATVAVAGPLLEGGDFWRGVGHVRRGFDGDWLEGAAVVVAPSWVEHRPRRLLEAVARGVPVVAFEACGLGRTPGVVEIPTGDGRALVEAVAEILGARDPRVPAGPFGV